jgi:hypothetical protein
MPIPSSLSETLPETTNSPGRLLTQHKGKQRLLLEKRAETVEAKYC